MGFRRQFFVLNVALIFTLSCKHIDCPPQEPLVDYRPGQEMKDYGYFLKGSYWVFVNDSTTETDSIAIASNDSTSIEIGYKSNCGYWITGNKIVYYSNNDQVP